MPFRQFSPWGEATLSLAASAGQVGMPADDSQAYAAHPRRGWVYNRMLVAQSQGLACGPHTQPPQRYPVICRPVMSLEPFAQGYRIARDYQEFARDLSPAEFWMEMLSGERVWSDIAVVDGEMVWSRHAVGVCGSDGRMDYWSVQARSRPCLERYCAQWICKSLPGHRGMLSIETIGNRIIGVRLRASDQWYDLYGYKWPSAVGGLYRHGTWDLMDAERVEGFSLLLYDGGHSGHRQICEKSLAAHLEILGIHSVRFKEPSGVGSFPVIGVVNCFNLEAGRRLCARIAAELRSIETQRSIPH